MNIFAGLQKYATKFEVSGSREFNAEELASVNSAKIVASQYGLSVCFFMKEGCQKYIPLSIYLIYIGTIRPAHKIGNNKKQQTNN